MDQPHIFRGNFSIFYSQIVQDEKNDIDEGSSDLLEIGSCNLYVLRGAYKTAQSATIW